MTVVTMSSSDHNLLELRDVRAAYDGIDVLYGIDLEVPRGSVVALLGPNGAGKTTTLRVASGLHAASGGDVLVAGRRVNGARPEELARHGLCLVPEGRGIFPNLSVRENVRMMTYSGRNFREVEEVTMERFPRLRDRRSQVAGTLSGGEQQMLAMARGLATDPALLLLDELSMGLAPIIVEELYEIVAQIARDGVSILVVEQFARTVLGVADYAVIMVHGRIAKVGRPGELEAELSTAYLGARERMAEMIESPDRVEQFKAEIADMKLRDPATSRDRIWLGVGIALMAVGVVLAIVAYVMSHETSNVLQQNDANTLAIGGAIAAIIGAALLLRYSIASFLRFWLARLIYEQKAQTDRLLEREK